MRKSFDDVLAYTDKALGWIEAQAIEGKEQEDFLNEVAENYGSHINPGFLEYRKAAGGDALALEWKAEGDHFWDIQGREYIDCLGGFGVYNCGHRNPTVVKAVTDQIAKQPLSSAELVDANRALLARILADVTPGDLKYTFFTSSGTEAIESAIKFAALSTGRHHFIAFEGDFHGKTHGSLSMTAKSDYRGPFLPLLQGTRHCKFGDLDMLRKTVEVMDYVGELPAAIIFEPIQGENGIIIPPDDFIPGIRQICDEYGILMVADEVQAGMGRTGTLFAVDYYDVAPDILCLAKALGGGVMPVSACVCTEEAFKGMFPNPLLHSTTTGGSPTATAAAIACFNVMLKEDLPGKSKRAGEMFTEGLTKVMKKYPKLMTDVRGRGLFMAMEFVDGDMGYEVVYEMFNRKVLVSGSLINAKTIRVEPPLTISDDHIKHAIEVIDESCAVVYKKHNF